MGGGVDAAAEVASIVLLGDRPTQVPHPRPTPTTSALQVHSSAPVQPFQQPRTPHLPGACRLPGDGCCVCSRPLESASGICQLASPVQLHPQAPSCRAAPGAGGAQAQPRHIAQDPAESDVGIRIQPGGHPSRCRGPAPQRWHRPHAGHCGCRPPPSLRFSSTHACRNVVDCCQGLGLLIERFYLRVGPVSSVESSQNLLVWQSQTKMRITAAVDVDWPRRRCG